MADKSNPSEPAKPSGRGSRRPRTIDVEATDVTPKPAAASSSASDENEPPYTEAPKTGTAWLPGGGARPMLAGIALGAVFMFIVIIVLWTAGYVGGNAGSDTGSRAVTVESQPRERPAAPRNADSRALEDLAARVDRLE